MDYELMVILKPMLPEDIRDEVDKKIEKLVEKGDGEITNRSNWGKRHLAYPINNQDEGYYLVYELRFESSYSNKFQEELKYIDDIMRHILVKRET